MLKMFCSWLFEVTRKQADFIQIVLNHYNLPLLYINLYRILGNIHVRIFLRICAIVVFHEYKFCKFVPCLHSLAIITVWPHPKHISHTWTWQWKRCSKWTSLSEGTMFIKRYGRPMEKKSFLLSICHTITHNWIFCLTICHDHNCKK